MKYIYLCSTDSLEYHPTNTTWDFTMELPQTLYGHWQCALGEISYTSITEELVVFSDFCEASCINDRIMPVLRVVSQSGEIERLQFVPLNLINVQRIRIYVRDRNMNVPTHDVGPLRCTLLLKPIHSSSSNDSD